MNTVNRFMSSLKSCSFKAYLCSVQLFSNILLESEGSAANFPADLILPPLFFTSFRLNRHWIISDASWFRDEDEQVEVTRR